MCVCVCMTPDHTFIIIIRIFNIELEKDPEST